MIRSLNSKERAEDVYTSVLRIYRETRVLPKYFAYPYGETSQEFIQELKNYNWSIDGNPFRFQAAFTTQSGPAGCSSNLFALPRFALNMRYGTINDLFRTKMNSLHFPIRNFIPADLAFCSQDHIQKFIIETDSHQPLNGMQCFATNGKNVITLKSPHYAEIILSNPLTNNSRKDIRHRINCTLSNGKGRFFWLGKEFAVLNCKN